MPPYNLSDLQSSNILSATRNQDYVITGLIQAPARSALTTVADKSTMISTWLSPHSSTQWAHYQARAYSNSSVNGYHMVAE